VRLQVAVQTGRGRTRTVTAERLVNMYAEQSSGGKSLVVLHGTPGLVLEATYGAGPVRGLHVMRGTRYIVSGGALYNQAGTNLGVINGTGPVSMATDGTHLVIVTSATTGYVYTTAGGLQTITDPAFPGATSVDYIDTYFLFTEPNSNRFFISEQGDPLSLDALDFASAESAPNRTSAAAHHVIPRPPGGAATAARSAVARTPPAAARTIPARARTATTREWPASSPSSIRGAPSRGSAACRTR
jgi:hypothetical protein